MRIAGGYAKDTAPFSEFLWADFFRPRVDARLIVGQQSRATRMGCQVGPIQGRLLSAGLDRQSDLFVGAFTVGARVPTMHIPLKAR